MADVKNDGTFLIAIMAGCEDCDWYVDDGPANPQKIIRQAQRHCARNGHTVWLERTKYTRFRPVEQGEEVPVN